MKNVKMLLKEAKNLLKEPKISEKKSNDWARLQIP